MRILTICVALLMLTVTSAVSPGCASNAKPETTILQVGTTVLGAVTELQKGITAATDQHSLPVPLAQQLTGYVTVVHDKAGPLEDALKAYHAATSVNVRTATAAQIVKLIGDMNNAINNVLGTALPAGVVAELSKLVGKVLEAIGAVQLEVAKGLK